MESVGDPGNLGTMLRCGAAASVRRLWLAGPGCVDPCSPKVLRSSAGYWFRVPVQAAPEVRELVERTLARQGSWQVLACMPPEEADCGDRKGSLCFWNVDFRRPTLVLLGTQSARART